MRWRYFPFLLNFFLIVFYTTLIHEFESDEDIYEGWNLSSFIFGILILLCSIYFVILEIQKLKKYGFKDLSSLMIIELIYIILTIAMVISKFSGVSDLIFRTISVFVLGFGYFQFIMYLRLFDSLAVLISMMYYITKEIIFFTLVFLLAIISFANMFFVI